MKNNSNSKRIFLVLFSIISIHCFSQFGGLKDIVVNSGAALGAKKLGLDKIIKTPAAITTFFEDVDQTDSKLPNTLTIKNSQPLYLLPKATGGGYVLCEGFFEMTNKSYCLKAGTYAPSKGDGYMYAPTLGPKEKIVTTILKNAENHPEIKQEDIQMLLWTIIAKTKFSSYSGQVKLTAIALLSGKELAQLEGGMLGVLPQSVMNDAKSKLPTELQAVFEAENKIRSMVASGNYTYAEMEKYAIVAGMAPVRSDIPSGIWTKHPDGYFVRYFPEGFSKTKVQIYVPKEILSSGEKIIYDATDDIACPANVGSQRLAQTNEAINPDVKLKLSVNCK